MQQLAKGAAVQELHGQVNLPVGETTEVIDAHDVVVADGRGGQSLALKAADRLGARGNLGTEQLQRHDLADIDVLGSVDSAHPARTHPVEQPETPGDYLADPAIILVPGVFGL